MSDLELNPIESHRFLHNVTALGPQAAGFKKVGRRDLDVVSLGTSESKLSGASACSWVILVLGVVRSAWAAVSAGT